MALVGGMLLMTSCTFLPVKKLTKGADKVLVAKQKPAGNCRNLGVVESMDSWLMRDMFTDNNDLAKSSFNFIRNQAHLLGANYAQVLNYDNEKSSFFGVLDFTRMPLAVGVAYQCPE